MNLVSYRARLVSVFIGLLVLAVAFGFGVRSSRAADPQMLGANFYADGSMTMALGDGTPVRTGTLIPPGTYEVVIDTTRDDLGVVHMFHIFGPNVDISTDLTQGDEDQAVLAVTFQPNSTYTFQDDYRPTLVHVVFGTSASGSSRSGSSGGSSSASSGATPSGSGKSSGSVSRNASVVGSAIVPFRGALDATVYKSGKLTLTRNGKTVSSLKQGRYTINVDDEAKTSGFLIQQIHKQPVTVTTAKFVGSHALTIPFKAGQWFFYSASHEKSYFFVVA